jgi:hypothetical protein
LATSCVPPPPHSERMIKAVIVINNNGKPRALKFYERLVSGHASGEKDEAGCTASRCQPIPAHDCCRPRTSSRLSSGKSSRCCRSGPMRCATSWRAAGARGELRVSCIGTRDAEAAALRGSGNGRWAQISSRSITCCPTAATHTPLVPASERSPSPQPVLLRQGHQADLPALRDALLCLCGGPGGERAGHPGSHPGVCGGARQVLRERVRAGPHLPLGQGQLHPGRDCHGRDGASGAPELSGRQQPSGGGPITA